MKKAPCLICLAAAWLLPACEKEKSASTASTASPVVARAGGEVITVADVEKEAQRRLAGGIPLPDKGRLVEEMLERAAAVARAKQAGVADDPATKRELENVLIARLRTVELEAKLAAAVVSDEELKAAFAAADAGREARAKARFAILHIQGDGKMSDAKRAQLRARMDEALQKAAASPKDGGVLAAGFGQVAAEYSDDQGSRYQGGDIGWLEQGNFTYRWPKAVLEAGFQLEKGQCSPVIEDNGSLYAVMKTDAQAAAKPSFEEMKGRLQRDLLQKKRREIEESFRNGNRASTGAEVNAEVLSKLTLPQPSGPAANPDPAPPAFPGNNPGR